jgi:hypothetical protein
MEQGCWLIWLKNGISLSSEKLWILGDQKLIHSSLLMLYWRRLCYIRRIEIWVIGLWCGLSLIRSNRKEIIIKDCHKLLVIQDLLRRYFLHGKKLLKIPNMKGLWLNLMHGRIGVIWWGTRNSLIDLEHWCKN